MPARDEPSALHPRLYLYEGLELGLFMLSACAFTVLLYHPASPAVHAIGSPLLRRALMAASMAVTAVGIIYSPMGKASGAHFNPAITLAFLYLRKIGTVDACWYVVAHFTGAIAGVGLSALLFGSLLAAPEVNYAVTVPGSLGPGAAFSAEFFMATALLATVLTTSNHPRLARYTTVSVGILIFCYVLIFAPVSGFSINPARTIGSAVWANIYTALWIYFVAPLLGMFTAAAVYLHFHPAVKAAHPHRPHYFKHRHLTQKAPATDAH